MRKLLLLLPFITLLAACQKETIDSKRTCALWDAKVLTPNEASALLGITESMTEDEYWAEQNFNGNDDWNKLWKYCQYFLDGDN